MEQLDSSQKIITGCQQIMQIKRRQTSPVDLLLNHRATRLREYVKSILMSHESKTGDSNAIQQHSRLYNLIICTWN